MQRDQGYFFEDGCRSVFLNIDFLAEKNLFEKKEERSEDNVTILTLSHENEKSMDFISATKTNANFFVNKKQFEINAINTEKSKYLIHFLNWESSFLYRMKNVKYIQDFNVNPL